MQPGWKCRSCPRDDVPWVGLPSVHGWHPAEQPRPVWQCRQHWLPPSPARPVLHQPARRALRSPLPGAPAGRPSGRPAAHLGDAVGAGLSTLPGVLGPWGDRARRRVRMGCVCPRAEPKLGTASQAWGGGGEGNSFKTPSRWHCPQRPHTPCSALGTREGLEGPGQGGRSQPPPWLVLSCRRRVGGAVPVIRRVRANYSPKLAGFKGLCRRRWGWRGRAWLQLGVGLARWLACADGSAQPPLHHRNLCPSLRLREVNPPLPPALQGFPSSRLKPLVDLAVAGLRAPRDLVDRCRMRPECVGQRDKAAYFQRCWRRRLLQL